LNQVKSGKANIRNRNNSAAGAGLFSCPDPGMVALNRWLDSLGRNAVTGWRWRRDGWIETVNVAGRQYITTAEIRRFETPLCLGTSQQRNDFVVPFGDRSTRRISVFKDAWLHSQLRGDFTRTTLAWYDCDRQNIEPQNVVCHGMARFVICCCFQVHGPILRFCQQIPSVISRPAILRKKAQPVKTGPNDS
jgi:hypothetical protein